MVAVLIEGYIIVAVEYNGIARRSIALKEAGHFSSFVQGSL
jgi:hypothetical protein